MSSSSDTPQVWVGCLEAYNNGQLHGRWIDATDADEMNDDITQILSSCPNNDPEGLYGACEEFHVCDSEGFGSYAVGRYESVESIATVGAALAEHGPAFAAWLGLGWHDGLDPDEWADRFEEQYQGEYESEADYAEELIHDCYDLEAALGRLPEIIRYAVSIDWEQVTNELNLASVSTGGHTVYVFDSCGY